MEASRMQGLGLPLTLHLVSPTPSLSHVLVRKPIKLNIYRSIYLSVYLSFCLSVYLSIYVRNLAGTYQTQSVGLTRLASRGKSRNAWDPCRYGNFHKRYVSSHKRYGSFHKSQDAFLWSISPIGWRPPKLSCARAAEPRTHQAQNAQTQELT